MENTREIILDALLELEKGEAYSHQLLRNVLDKYDYLDPRDKSFIKMVTEGTIERRIELDYDLDHYSSVPVKKMKPLIRCLLRMSVYQILYMDGTPDSAVCNEACKLAAKRKFRNLTGFVNGVLRKIAREKDHMPFPDRKLDEMAYFCVRYSMPDWIVKSWLDEYGSEVTERILSALLEIHPVSMRIVDDLTPQEKEALLEKLKEEGANLQKSPYLPCLYKGTGLDGLKNLSAFQEGKVIVQDASSVLAVKMAGIKKGDFVIDVCGAPGGKAILASEQTGELGRVITGDISEIKTEKIRENRDRMRRGNLEIRIWDGRVFCPELREKADVLLLDVPCSGLGVIGKKRDIKYRVREAGLPELESLQKEILQNAWQYLTPGGTLLYSTCTIRHEENTDMVNWILDNLPFEPVSIESDLPEEVFLAVKKEREARKTAVLSTEREACCAQLLPGILETDGFFFAKLRRKD